MLSRFDSCTTFERYVLRKEFINILSVRKDKSPLKPGTLLKRYFTKHGKESVKALSDILDINLVNTRKLLNANIPFKECHYNKIRKKLKDFDIDSFINSNNVYEEWRSVNKPRIRPDYTDGRIIVSLLRQLFLKSRERSLVMKRAQHKCEICGVSDKDTKFQCHHKSKEINWEKIIGVIREELLCPSDELTYICNECHMKIHHMEKKGNQLQ